MLSWRYGEHPFSNGQSACHHFNSIWIFESLWLHVFVHNTLAKKSEVKLLVVWSQAVSNDKETCWELVTPDIPQCLVHFCSLSALSTLRMLLATLFVTWTLTFYIRVYRSSYLYKVTSTPTILHKWTLDLEAISSLAFKPGLKLNRLLIQQIISHVKEGNFKIMFSC